MSKRGGRCDIWCFSPAQSTVQTPDQNISCFRSQRRRHPSSGKSFRSGKFFATGGNFSSFSASYISAPSPFPRSRLHFPINPAAKAAFPAPNGTSAGDGGASPPGDDGVSCNDVAAIGESSAARYRSSPSWSFPPCPFGCLRNPKTLKCHVRV